MLIDFDAVADSEKAKAKPKSKDVGPPKGSRNAAKDKENKVTNGHIKLSERGPNTVDRTLGRLKRDHPELAKRVVAGELSANAAAIEAG